MKEKEIFDDYTWTEHKKIIPLKKHGISGLGNFSHFTLSTDNTVPLHYHSDIIELHCIIKGERTVQIAEDGIMNTYTAHGNELTLTYPFELHEVDNSTMNRNEFYAIQINIRKGTAFLGLNEEYRTLLLQELLHLPHRHLKVGHSQISLLRTAFNLFAYGNEADKRSAVSYLTCFLFNLKYLEPVYNQRVYGPVNDAVQKSIQYISENIENPICLQKLADVSGYSLSHFKFKFKEYFGITPAEYISLQKIKMAEKKLMSSDVSITDLAYMYGFSSSNYFCTVFKKVLGYSPSDYRKLFKET